MNIKHLAKWWDILLVILLFVFLNLIFSRLQQPMTLNEGIGWDGVYYAKITQDFSNGLRPDTLQPFVYRLAVPFLASRMGADIVASWRILGLIANVLTIILLYIFLSTYFQQKWLRVILLLLFLLPFHSLIRRIWYNPLSTDFYDKIFLIGGLLLVDRIRLKGWSVTLSLLLSLVTFTGVFFREIVLVVPFVALFAGNPVEFDKEKLRIRSVSLPPILSILPILAGITGLVLIKLIVTPSQDEFFLTTAAKWLYDKSLPDYLLGWFIAFGPILILPLYDWRNSARVLLDHQHLLAYLLVFSLLGWIGGSATYRLLDWTMPVVFILVGLSIQNNLPLLRQNKVFTVVWIASYLVSQRVFWLIPDYPGGVSTLWFFLTPVTKNPPYLDIIGMGSRQVNAIAFASYIFLSAVLFFILTPPKFRFRGRKSPDVF